MAEMVLTAARREELAAFLDDEQRLRAEYPQVADYLTTASQLRGTGNSEADALFDVRLLHFMTGGRSVSENPYWDIVAPLVSEWDGRRVVNGGSPDGSARLGFAQTILQAAYAYAIPSPDTITWMSEFCGGRPVVELGAGRGYWAYLLARAGVTIHAYELEPPHEADNVSFPRTTGQEDVWFSVAGLDQQDFDGHLGSVLFLSWPPGWGNTMASEALSAFEKAGGDRLVYIGEPKGGKTGDDAFFVALSDHWALETSDSSFVSWWNLADVAQGWVRS